MMKQVIFSALFLGAIAFQADLQAQCSSTTTAQHAVPTQRTAHSYGVQPQADPTIVDIAVGSKDHTTLVAALGAAGLVEALQGAGPFTVFAPTNGAFGKLPAGTVETLLKPENKATLTKVLTYHVIAGSFDSKTLVNAIENNGGKVTFKTLAGGKITAALANGGVVLTDEKGGKAKISAVDLKGSNGYIHVIDTVVMPK